jgi:Uma2 family endonuclease
MVKTPIATSGEVVAAGISFEDFLTQFDGQSVEWVNGEVIEMSPVSTEHTAIARFLISLLDYFLAVTKLGEVYFEPMTMRPLPELPARSPDIQVVLRENIDIVQHNLVAGPADLVIEIVSPESHRRDRVEKFAEYEQGGVPEYWILDPVRRETLFYQRNADGLYEPVEPDDDGVYRCRTLPKLQLPATIFWQDPLPRGPEIAAMVETMLQS